MNNTMSIIETIKDGLIVSCQALPDEPLHSPFIMARMAIAAMRGGAVGIRANSPQDIVAIKAECPLPMIGIIKRDYPDSSVFITATLQEVDELAATGCEIIALDATHRVRPDGVSLENIIEHIRSCYPNLLIMADCATVSEAIAADRLGVDLIGTTLVGYTEQSAHLTIGGDNFAMLRKIIAGVNAPVIAEGNINTPEMARTVLELGAHAVVVGSMITRPQLITEKFVAAIRKVTL